MNEIIKLSDMSHRQHAHINLAKHMADEAAQSYCFRHGAVLVTGGRVIRAAANTWKHSSLGTRFRNVKLGKATRHAEVSCVTGIDKELTDNALMYVVRIGRGGDLRMSKPCEMCQAVLSFVGIRSVIYSIDAETFGKLRL